MTQRSGQRSRSGSCPGPITGSQPQGPEEPQRSPTPSNPQCAPPACSLLLGSAFRLSGARGLLCTWRRCQQGEPLPEAVAAPAGPCTPVAWRQSCRKPASVSPGPGTRSTRLDLEVKALRGLVADPQPRTVALTPTGLLCCPRAMALTGPPRACSPQPPSRAQPPVLRGRPRLPHESWACHLHRQAGHGRSRARPPAWVLGDPRGR